MQLDIEEHDPGKADICEPILRALPEWFAVERSIRQYLKDIDTMPTLIAKANGKVAGFLTIKRHSEYSAEVHVMGVRPEMHGRGIGSELMQRAEASLCSQGFEYLQVKTLGPSAHSNEYERTRAFYQAMGFRPLEEFPDLWDKDNPCLMMVKKL